jgi:hypothetical protein
LTAVECTVPGWDILSAICKLEEKPTYMLATGSPGAM